jgi:uncharacterized protein involved in type VI secretion and phage assembly
MSQHETGLLLATVKNLYGDPEKNGRILVAFASPKEQPAEMWARVASFYATSNAGVYFQPEVGDEVVVGFLDTMAQMPVVLGSLYSAQNKAPRVADDDNNYVKSLTTKSGITISFDDKKKTIILQTPGRNQIQICDEDRSISITDQNRNAIKLSDSGIELNSAKDITLKATGSVTIEATGKISLDSKQSLQVSANDVHISAKTTAAVIGSAAVELSSSGQTTVKGGMVMIN